VQQGLIENSLNPAIGSNTFFECARASVPAASFGPAGDRDRQCSMKISARKAQQIRAAPAQ
jgi:hypothetical protein